VRPSGRFWSVLLAGCAYAVIGVVSASLANPSSSHPLRAGWRLAAWGMSAVVFLAHVAYEHVHRRSRPGWTAWHAALAVAIGGFLLAASASLHRGSPLVAALLVWPLLAGIPAGLAALAITWVVARWRPR